MQTKDFRTRTIINATPFPGKKDEWIIALDIGYSAVKGISQNGLWCFPSYAKRIPSDRESLGAPNSSDIRYKDNNGNYWVVGNLAYNEATMDDVHDSVAEHYGRHWMLSEEYRIIASVGFALGLQTNSFGNPEGKKIVIQTGLPPKQLFGDARNDILDALEGHYSFELAIGGNSFKKYDFDIARNNIYIMAQPLGALISASTEKKGKSIAEARKYFSSDVLVFDPGFNTVDTYHIHKGEVIKENCETFEHYGMLEIFQRTCNDINNQYNTAFTVVDIQANLENGKLKIVNKKKMQSFQLDFSDILEKNRKLVCSEVIEKLKSVYNYFAKVDYIIAAGGTYDAWKDYIAEVFQDMDSLELISANSNDTSLSNIFSNVRGYYFYRINSK